VNVRPATVIGEPMSKKQKNKKSGDNCVDLLDREKEKQKIKPPSKYKVVFHNDDYTPMDFVVITLVVVFNKSPTDAYQIMMNVHEKGRGIAGGPYSKEIAETKANKAMAFARAEGHPLKVTFEKE
jgi:ATP-dependent Clp protease adaptor protein ClpS